jgi:hypothetical protein
MITVDEFYAFTDTRPDEERWELIDGQLVLNEPPYVIHQWLIKNVLVAHAGRSNRTAFTRHFIAHGGDLL